MNELIATLNNSKNIYRLLYKILSNENNSTIYGDKIKNVNNEELLLHLIDNLPPFYLNKYIFPNLSKLFSAFIANSNRTGIINTLNIFNKFRVGLATMDLLEFLHQDTIENNIRLNIALTISNFNEPQSEFWVDILNESKFNFLLPAVLNKLKLINPKKAIELFLEKEISDFQPIYIPIKRSILNILSDHSFENIYFLTNSLEYLEGTQQFEKCQLISSILNLEELSEIRSKYFMPGYNLVFKKEKEAELEIVCNKIMLLSTKSEKINLDFYFSNIDKSIIISALSRLIHDIENTKIMKIDQYFIDWLEYQMGNQLVYCLNNENIYYDIINGNLLSNKNVLPILYDEKNGIDEYIRLDDDYGVKREAIISKIIQNG